MDSVKLGGNVLNGQYRGTDRNWWIGTVAQCVCEVKVKLMLKAALQSSNANSSPYFDRHQTDFRLTVTLKCFMA
jgi:hypothetical protein